MKKTFIIMSAIAFSLGVVACGNKKGDNKEQPNNDTSMQISKKQQVVELLKAIETGASEPVGYINADNYKQHNPSGRTMTDGTTEIKDLEKTADNKALARSFVDNILVNGRMEKLAGYFDGDNYIQHNPNIPDQLSGLGKALEVMAKQGITMTYSQIHKVLGEGNFVLVVSEGQIGGVHSSFYDLFRIENGKIAEHWDTIEPIAAKETWKNQSGKFGF